MERYGSAESRSIKNHPREYIRATTFASMHRTSKASTKPCKHPPDAREHDKHPCRTVTREHGTHSSAHRVAAQYSSVFRAVAVTDNSGTWRRC
jgi:hypothetical protein